MCRQAYAQLSGQASAIQCTPDPTQVHSIADTAIASYSVQYRTSSVLQSRAISAQWQVYLPNYVLTFFVKKIGFRVPPIFQLVIPTYVLTILGSLQLDCKSVDESIRANGKRSVMWPPLCT